MTIQNKETNPLSFQNEEEIAIFAGGCFWCTEALFLELNGVSKVIPGYIGGHTSNPTYTSICSGTTGHAEAIKITFNSQIICFGELLEIFFATHDPTTLNRQGNDVGTQYRSEVFYTNGQQKIITQEYLDLMKSENTYENPIVTKISPLSIFYEAEDYHKNYYNQNQFQGYCSYVITPKIEKLRHKFQSKLKKII